MTEIERKLAEKNGVLDAMYSHRVNELIRARYTISEELAILRQRDKKPDEFEAYNAYAEECKRKAKADVYGEEGTP